MYMPDNEKGRISSARKMRADKRADKSAPTAVINNVQLIL